MYRVSMSRTRAVRASAPRTPARQRCGERIRDLPQPSLQEENTPVPGCSAVPDADQQPDTSAPQECCPLPKVPWRAWEQQLADLITRMTQGDQRALEDFYDATSALVYGLALRIVQESSAAEDVTLEVYMQVREQAMRYDPSRGTPSAWLLTLTRSRAIDQRRRLSVQQQREHPLEQADHKLSPLPDPEVYSASMELRQAVHTALAALSPEQRQVIEIAYYTGLSHSEIATRLGQPLGTVKTRMRTGMIALRTLLQPLLT